MKKTAEDLLELNLTRCTEGVAACLANAEEGINRESPYSRTNEMDRAVALLNASARLAEALARLRGPTQTIRVTREGGLPPKRDSNGT